MPILKALPVFCKGMRVEGCALPPLDLLSRRHHNPWAPAQTWAGERQARREHHLTHKLPDDSINLGTTG